MWLKKTNESIIKRYIDFFDYLKIIFIDFKFMRAKSNFKKFFEGMGNIDLFPTSLKDPTNGKSDEELLRSDWLTIGSDFRIVISKINKDYPHNEQHKKTSKG